MLMVQFFFYQLFKDNLIDTDLYVFAMNMAKEGGGQVQKNINVKQCTCIATNQSAKLAKMQDN